MASLLITYFPSVCAVVEFLKSVSKWVSHKIFSHKLFHVRYFLQREINHIQKWMP